MPPAESVRFHDLFADPLRNGLTRPKAVRGQGTKMVNMGEIFAHERIGEVSMERVPLSDRERESYLAGREWFKPWRTISGERLADPHVPELQVMLEGVFDKRRLLDLVRHFIVFEDAGGGPLVKKMAGYHQFHAVNVAVAETLRAAHLQQEADQVAEPAGRYEAGPRPGGQPGDRRIGVVWHTQGSG